jgi:hypothetical protein
MKKTMLKKLAALGTVLAIPGIALAQGWATGLTNLGQTGLPGSNGATAVQTLIFNIMQWMLTILAAIGIVGFVIAGIMYLLSGGDDTRMKTAKNAMVAAIIGVLVGIMGLVIIYAAQNFLIGNTQF